MAPPSVMQPSGGGVPAPQYRWGLRVGLPAALIAALFAIFASSLWSAVTPILDVTALPVVERPGARAAQASSGAVVAQAAGWIEPDPFPVAAAALTEGTVEEVLFLEGSEVRKGDVLVRLVGRDAQLELERAQAEFDAAGGPRHGTRALDRGRTGLSAPIPAARLGLCFRKRPHGIGGGARLAPHAGTRGGRLSSVSRRNRCSRPRWP